MRARSITAALGTAVLVASSVLMTAGPASAATTIDNVTFYDATDFGVEGGGSYPGGVDWFFGEVSGTEGSAAFTSVGIEFNTGADGSVQILNQNVATPLDALELTDIVGNVDIVADSTDWTFQLPFFAEGPSSGFTTLRPVAQGSLDPSANWITSGAIAATGSTPAYSAGDQASLIDFAAALYGDAAPALLAYGFFVDPGDAPVIQAINWDGQISAFTPVYAPVVTPTTITTVDLADPAKGIALSFAGSLPGTAVYIDLENAAGDSVYSDFGQFVAADGTFSTNLVIPNLAAGTYTLTFDDDGYAYFFLGLGQQWQITVTPALAATGFDATVPVGVALFTLLGGALAVFYARRQSARA